MTTDWHWAHRPPSPPTRCTPVPTHEVDVPSLSSANPVSVWPDRNARLSPGSHAAAAAESEPVRGPEQLPARRSARCRLLQHLRRCAAAGPVADDDLVRPPALNVLRGSHPDHVVDRIPRGHAEDATTAAAASARRILGSEPAAPAPHGRRHGRQFLRQPANAFGRAAGSLASLHAAAAAKATGPGLLPSGPAAYASPARAAATAKRHDAVG
jgi:hypothetical protein